MKEPAARDMSFRSPQPLLGPRSIAIVGASERAKWPTMLGALKLAKLLAGFRGRPAADIDALVTAICGLSEFYLDHRHLLNDLEINPLIVRAKGHGVCAVDIRRVPVTMP